MYVLQFEVFLDSPSYVIYGTFPGREGAATACRDISPLPPPRAVVRDKEHNDSTLRSGGGGIYAVLPH